MKKDHPTKQNPTRSKPIPAYSLSVETLEEHPGQFVVRVWRLPNQGSKRPEQEVARLGMTSDFLAALISVGLGRLAEQEKAAEPAALVSPEGEKLL